MRALSIAGGSRFTTGSVYKSGLSGFGPNINIIRDPRFGRNCELPSEDPFLSGSYASEYVKGMQQRDEKGYYRMRSYLKHFDAYSRETNRGHDSYNISKFDFGDTYLPQYKLAFKEANASGVMCSYNGENGVPSCANGWLLEETMRKDWGQPDAIVTSDCGAVSNLKGDPVNAPDDTTAASYALMNGTDIEMGSTLYSTLYNATVSGLVPVEKIDEVFRRVVLHRMTLGLFDPPEFVHWNNIITPDQFGSKLHKEINYNAALQSLVLLKNDEKHVLPLKEGLDIGVVGPQAFARHGLFEDYAADEICFGGGYLCVENIAEALTNRNSEGGGNTFVAQGVDVNSHDDSGIEEALEIVRKVDVVILVLGIDTQSIEHEGLDRVEIGLPGLQEPFAQMVLGEGKPTVLLFTNGGALAIDTLMEGPNAIIEAFYPGFEGARAIASTLFGDFNLWGKLPFTVYPSNYVQQVDMTNYDISLAPGRTYRYYIGKPLYEFGYGLSYTEFGMDCDQHSINGFSFSCNLKNVGSYDGDAILLVYHYVSEDIRSRCNHPVPLKNLRHFERINVRMGSNAVVDFELQKEDLYVTDGDGENVLYEGTHYFVISLGVGEENKDRLYKIEV